MNTTAETNDDERLLDILAGVHIDARACLMLDHVVTVVSMVRSRL